MGTHGCPGDCGAQVAHHQLACRRCWYRLPQVLREDVTNAYRRRADNPAAHRAALLAASQWYRANPLGGD